MIQFNYEQYNQQILSYMLIGNIDFLLSPGNALIILKYLFYVNYCNKIMAMLLALLLIILFIKIHGFQKKIPNFKLPHGLYNSNLTLF